MTDKQPGLQAQRVNTAQPAPMGQEVPPITESNLIVTAVIVVLAFLLLGPVVLISALFLGLAYLKLKENDYEKAISYNRAARITGIIFLVAGIILIALLVILPIIFVILYVAIAVPLLIA